MATILNGKSGTSDILRPLHVFGRNANSNTYLNTQEASRIHAVINWDAENWVIKDLSANGSYLNKKRLEGGKHYQLCKGDKLQFGGLDSDVWVVEDISAPVSMLIPHNFEGSNIVLKKFLVLPDECNPEVTLYQENNGKWYCESAFADIDLKSGDLVGTTEKIWQFIEAQCSSKTASINEENENIGVETQFCFDVSRCEEHVFLRAKCGDKTYDLGERSHHYLLLLLARQRLEDMEKFLPEKEQGWIKKDLLCRMLGTNEYNINTQIFRLRKQLVDLSPGSQSLHRIIERRSGEIRFAHKSIVVEGGCVVA